MVGRDLERQERLGSPYLREIGRELIDVRSHFAFQFWTEQIIGAGMASTDLLFFVVFLALSHTMILPCASLKCCFVVNVNIATSYVILIFVV